jgi:succinylglutamate desuccinylase
MNSVKQSNQIKHYMHSYSFLILLSAVIAIGLAKNVAANQISVHEKIENEIHSYIKGKIDKSPDKKNRNYYFAYR